MIPQTKRQYRETANTVRPLIQAAKHIIIMPVLARHLVNATGERNPTGAKADERRAPLLTNSTAIAQRLARIRGVGEKAKRKDTR